MKSARRLFLCILPVFASGCGEFSHDVGHDRPYRSGGYVPGHILHLKTDAIVIAPTDSPYRTFVPSEGVWTMTDPPSRETASQHFLQRAEMPYPPLFKVIRRVPAHSRLRVDSLRRRTQFLAGFTTLDAIEIHVTILDGRGEESGVIIEGDSDLSTNSIRLFGRTTNLPLPNPKYLEDITPGQTR